VIAVDTNVLVRLLTGDDPKQFQASEALFASEQIFVPVTVLLEAEWVLRAAYELTADDVCDAFARVLGLTNVSTTDSTRMAQAIAWHQQGLDFADAVNLALSSGLAAFKTFDAAFVKRAKGLSDCRVEKP